MEAVRAFNIELQGVYENKPPISRAKMAAITKAAIKAIKFYKHVVQSVEKFIMKCRPEYKVPGLYVMDSIVRQSRHQFGVEKDVFGPRFSKNIVQTFQHLCRCAESDRGKIVRVLNLWQKNNVFSPAVIQPLLDLCADPENHDLFTKVQQLVQAATGLAPSVPQPKPDASRPGQQPAMSKHITSTQEDSVQKDVLKTVAQLLQQSQGPQQLSLSAQEQQLQQLQLLQQQLLQQTRILHEPQQTPAAPLIDGNLLAQISALTSTLLLKSKDEPAKSAPQPAFDKKLLDFDYGESDDEDDKRDTGRYKAPEPQEASLPGNVQNLLNDPDIMKHLHQMSETIQKTEQLKSELTMQEARQKMLEQQQEEFNQQIQRPANPPEPPMPPRDSDPDIEIIDYRPPAFQSGPMAVPPPADVVDERDRGRHHKRGYGRSRSRTRSRSPGKRRRHSRSRSQDRHHRSHSRDRRRPRSRSRDRDRERRDHERERRKKGLPPIKEGHLSICTLTLWLGHLSKQTTEDDVAAEISKYGQIESINLVPPRGCAFVCMNNRKDAAKALDRLKGIKILGNTIKVAWATNKGVKESSFKDGWDVDHGVTYIPYGRLPDSHILEQLYDGGMVDEDTVPEFLKVAITSKPERINTNQEGDTMDTSVSPQQQPSNVTLPADIPMPQMAPGMAAPMMPGTMMPGMMPPMMPMGMMPPPHMMMPSMSMPPPMPGMMPPPMPGPLPPAPPPMPPMVPPPVSSGPPVSMPMMAPPLPATPVMPPLPVSQPPQTTAVSVHHSEANKTGIIPPVGQAAMAQGSQPMVVDSVPLPPVPPTNSINSSAGSQLAQAIQNIVAHSASITAVAGSAPGMMRPGTGQGQQSTTPVHTHATFSSGAPPPNFRAPNQPFDLQRAPVSQSGPSPQGPPQSPAGFPSHGGLPNMGLRGESPSGLSGEKSQQTFNSLGDWQAPGSSPLDNPINRAGGFGTPSELGGDALNRGTGIMGARPSGPGFNSSQENIRDESLNRKDSTHNDLDEVFGGGGDKDERIIRPHMGGPNQGLGALGPRMGGPNHRMGVPSPGGPNKRFGALNHGMGGGPNQRMMGSGQSVGGSNQRMGGPNQQRPMGPSGMSGPGPRMGGPGMAGPNMGMGPPGPRGLGSMPNQTNMSGRLPSPNSIGLPDNMEELNSVVNSANVGNRMNNAQQGPGTAGNIQRNSGNVGGLGLRPGMINNAGVMIMNARGMSPGGMQGGPRGPVGPGSPSPLLQRLSGPSTPAGSPGVSVSSLLRLPGPGNSGGMMTRGPGGSGVRFSLRGPNTQHGLGNQLGDIRPSGSFNRFGSPRFGSGLNSHKDFGSRFGRERERDRDWEHERNRDRERDHDRGRDHDRERSRDHNREHRHDGQRDQGQDKGRDKTQDKDANEEQPKNSERESRRTGRTRWNTIEETTTGSNMEKKDESIANNVGLVKVETSVPKEPQPAVNTKTVSEQREGTPEDTKHAPTQAECEASTVQHALSQMGHAQSQAEPTQSHMEREPSQMECASPQMETAPPQMETAPPHMEKAPPQEECAQPPMECAQPQMECAPPQIEKATSQVNHSPEHTQLDAESEHQQEYALQQSNCLPAQAECASAEKRNVQSEEQYTVDVSAESVDNDECSVATPTKTSHADDDLVNPIVNKSVHDTGNTELDDSGRIQPADSEVVEPN